MTISYTDALARLENARVKSTRPLIPPQILQEDLPLYEEIRLTRYPPLITIGPTERGLQPTPSLRGVEQPRLLFKGSTIGF